MDSSLFPGLYGRCLICHVDVMAVHRGVSKHKGGKAVHIPLYFELVCFYALAFRHTPWGIVSSAMWQATIIRAVVCNSIPVLGAGGSVEAEPPLLDIPVTQCPLCNSRKPVKKRYQRHGGLECFCNQINNVVILHKCHCKIAGYELKFCIRK